MPLRNTEQIIIRQALTNIAIKYKNQQYVADELFPIVDGVNKQTKVLKFLKAPWFRDEAGVRAEGNPAPVANLSVTTVDIDPVNYAIGTKITDEMYEQSRVAGNLDIQCLKTAMEFMGDKLDLKKERRASTILHSTNWSAVGAGGEDAAGCWGHSTAASDTFLADMRTGHDTIFSNTGKKANSLFLSYHAYSKLRIGPALLAYLYPQGWTPGMFVTTDALKILADVDRVIVGGASYTATEETVADDSPTMTQIWGTSGAETKGVGFLYYRPDAPSRENPSAGYQYRLKQDNGLARQGTQWREAANHRDAFDMEEDTDIVATGTDLGYMWKDTATT